MSSDGSPHDQDWNRAQRSETATQRLDRNWGNLLQELRVAQVGVQILTGFLLTLPFQQRFGEVSAGMRIVYLVTVSCAITATVLLAAPVALHRVLFRRHRLSTVVVMAHRCSYLGLQFLGLALTGAVTVVFDVVTSLRPALIAGGVTALGLVGFWLVLPLTLRALHDDGEEST